MRCRLVKHTGERLKDSSIRFPLTVLSLDSRWGSVIATPMLYVATAVIVEVVILFHYSHLFKIAWLMPLYSADV